MSKKINCDKCGVLIAELGKGSKWRTGSIALCTKCAESYRTKELVDALGRTDPFNSRSRDDDFGDILGKILGVNK